MEEFSGAGCAAVETAAARLGTRLKRPGDLPRADALAALLAGRAVRTYLGREARVERVQDGRAVVAVGRGDERVQVPLVDLRAGLDQLRAEGAVPVTIGALGPGATYVAAMLVELDGAAYADAPARVVLRAPAGDAG